MAILRAGGSALDAVEAGIKPVEANVEDTSVGVGGEPNMLGVVELDASIMDGNTRAAGAVGAMRGYAHPISVARKVMELLPHVFLAGEGADQFARLNGFEPSDLLTAASKARWEERSRQTNAEPGLQRYYEHMGDMRAQLLAARDPGKEHETVNFLAIDREHHIAGGVSTSGWPWKFPGRLGDSPVIGAGNYADDRYGAAACTGRGELAIRACTAFATVQFMKAGLPAEEAACEALRDVLSLEDEFAGPFNIVAVDASGRFGGASSRPDRTYLSFVQGQHEPARLPYRHVEF
jgi:beta-aspartyl-peptidase (threonine type)